MQRELSFGEDSGAFAFVVLVGNDQQTFEDLRRAAERFNAAAGGAAVDTRSFGDLNLIIIRRRRVPVQPGDAQGAPTVGPVALMLGTVFDPPTTATDDVESWTGRNGRYAWLKWEADTGTLEATSDFLGVRALFYAVVNGQLVLTTEPAVMLLARCIPKDLDPVGCVDMLQKGSCYGDRTLLKAVHYLPPASVLHYRAGHVTTRRRSVLPVELPDPASGTLDDFAHGLYERLLASTKRWAATQSQWRVFLSGGLDSRTCIALLHETGQLGGALNWGQQEVGDTLVARKIAQELGIPFQYLQLKHDHLAVHHEELISIAGGLTNAHITYLLAALHASAPAPGGYCIGYSGDPLTGHIRFETPSGKSAPPIEESVDHFHGALGRFFIPSELEELLLLPEWRSAIDQCRQDIKETMLAAGHDAPHYRRWIAAVLWCRQLRYSVFLPRVIDNFAPVFSPFEDLDVFKFALTFPPEALRGQAAYRRMLEKHSPQFAKFSNASIDSATRQSGQPLATTIYRRTVERLPAQLSRRLDYWSSPGWSIDPNADLRLGSAGYLRNLLNKPSVWDWALDRKAVTNLVEGHLADRKKAGLQVQALVTLIEAMRVAGPAAALR